MTALYKSFYRYSILFTFINVISCSDNTYVKPDIVDISSKEEGARVIPDVLPPIEDTYTSVIPAPIDDSQPKEGTGYLTVISEPTDAEIYIDGEKTANTPLYKFCMESDTHSVKILKRNYESYETPILIVKDIFVTLSVLLKKNNF